MTSSGHVTSSAACPIDSAFLDASKAFDKVLHNGLFVKLLRRNVPVSLVLLLRNWYNHLQCCVRRQNKMDTVFLFLVFDKAPYPFTMYVDDLLNTLRLSGYGLYIGQLFVECLLYADDDIVLMSPSCFGLRMLVNMCEQFGGQWDIKFNAHKSQLMSFAGNNPTNVTITMNNLPISWVNKVKYLGLYFLGITGKVDPTSTLRKFYGQFNNIISVLGKGSHEMNVAH